MKTFEVMEYLMNEIQNELDYNEWYFYKKNELMDEQCFKDKIDLSKYYNFLQKNNIPSSGTIKQNLKKIRELTLKLEKEIK